jgi:P4 family phage/plasmid primase-like protien
MENKNKIFFENNNFVHFSSPNIITTYLNEDGDEKKELKKTLKLNWKKINKENYKEYINYNDKTFYIITGKLSNITVLDIDDEDVYNAMIENKPVLKEYFTVKTNKGYHIYFKYNDLLSTTTNINDLEGIDIRNDGGLAIAPPTEYKLLNGDKAGYKFLGGEIKEMPKFLLKQLIPVKKIKKEQIKKEKDKNEILNDLKQQEVLKLINLLNEDRANNYDDWIKVGFIFCNELKENGRSIYHQFSSISTKYNKKETDQKYNSFFNDVENKLTIATLKMMAREDSPEEYAELYKNEGNIKSTYSLLEKDIAEYIIIKHLNNNFICHQLKPNEFHYFNGNSWVYDAGTHKLLKIIYDDLIKEYESIYFNTLDEKEKDITNKLIKKLKGKLTFINSIIDWIALLTFNSKFFEIIDENPDLLGFDNGVYEINNKLFREGKREDYITKTTGYDFPVQKDYGHKEDIKDFLRKVFPDENIKKFVVQTQAQALSGRKTEDLIYTHTGRGGNGKSIFTEILKNVFGDYFLNIPVAMLTKANNKGHNDPDPYMAKLKGVRYAISNEPKDGSSFNDSLIKNLASQEGLQYRLLYSNEPKDLNIQLKLNIYCNNKIKFNGEDGGMGRRMCVINYVSKFSKEEDIDNNVYLIDTKLSDKIKEWKQDYMKMLIDLHQNNYHHKPPKEIIEASKVYINDNNDVYKFVKDNYEKTNDNNDFIVLKDLKLSYQNNREYEQTKLKTLKESLEKIFNTNFIEEKKIKGRKYKSVILGWKIKCDDIEIEEEEIKSKFDI